ncbi:YciI family protein [Mycobacterium sp. 1274761.0]|uniref:YciI family protein n=1 Tax=Mycobacterium sp. 1274761.0 TaxID=1834077 RepID=UPI00351024DE
MTTIDVEEDIMWYGLLMHYQEAGELGLTEEDMVPAMAAFQAYADDLSAAGVLIGTEVFEPVVATTTVTARNGAPEIQDGPFADTKERLAGIFVIEVPNLDEALTWARRNPATSWGVIEIRPVGRTYAADRGWYAP